MSKDVGIYNGHGVSLDGTMDKGCTYKKGKKTYTEAELCAPITAAAVKYLKRSGVTIDTDSPKNGINMTAQVRRSNGQKVKVHVAIHCDWYKAKAGTLPLYTSASGRKLAAAMNKRVMQYTGAKTRGLGKRTDLYELNATNAPAVIFEVGSIKNDLKRMQERYDDYGKGIAHGICDYLGVEFQAKKKKK